MKTNLFKSLLVAVMAVGAMGGVNAQDFTTYYSQDYETNGVAVDWTTSTAGRFTPYLQTTNNNTYFTVDQNTRNNNGCTLTNSAVKLSAGTNFSMIFDLKIGNSNYKSPVKFYIKDASNKEDVFSLQSTAKNSTKWIINGNTNDPIELPGTGYNKNTNVKEGIESASYTWYTFQITRKDQMTYLTIVNTETKAIVLEKSVINTLSTEGGIGQMKFDTNRYYANIAMDNIIVRSIISSDLPTEIKYPVTTKYQLEDGTKIMEDKIEYVASGKSYTPSYENTFDDDLYRYTYKNGANEIKSVEKEEEIIIFFSREDLKDWNVEVKSIGDINKTLQTVTVKDAKSITVTFPRYLADKINLYQIKKNRYDRGYQQTKSNIVKNEEISETYNKISEDVVFYSEAENISTLSSTYSGNIPVRCSSGKAAYAATDAIITKLPAGTYTLTTAVFGGKGADFKFYAGEKNIFTISTVGWLSEETSSSFTLTEPTDIILKQAGNEGSSPKVLDYIIIRQKATTVSVSDAGYATYATKYNVEVPNDENVKVMTVTVNDDNSTITLNEVAAGTEIPAGTGILVKAAQGNHDFVVTSTEGTKLENNSLIAATTDVTSDGATFFALTKMDTKVGFAVVNKGVVIPAGKAYLSVPKASGAKFFGLDGEATGINSVKTAKADGAYYTLEGVKTTKPVKGLYIHNGKKIVVK